MALRDPVSVYVPANNAEAQLICNLLNEEGIEAFCMEDVSQAGVASLGLLPGIHKPQIWVELASVDDARSVLKEIDGKLASQGGKQEAELFCYECGEPVSASAATCPACKKTLDWSDESEGERSEIRAKQSDRPSSSSMERLRK